jgi:argininosuccinate lyase
MKLWEKGYKLDQSVESFMTGDDPVLDRALISYDCMGSIAHAKMLAKIGILTSHERNAIVGVLHEFILLAEKGQFEIQADDEDVHTAVEGALVKRLGDVGKKIHTGRSRNDQVLLDLRLYAREMLLEIAEDLFALTETLLSFAERHKTIPIPGRTHFQRAMPSSVGLWAGAFAESLLDDVELIKTAYTLVNQSPLGSAASYGVSLPIDRQYVADLLGFDKVQNNVLYVNNSRGKFEAVILNGLVQIMNDLAKVSADMIIFSAPEFGYLLLPEKFCPGSSLMPQKRNPCPLELIRAKSALVQGYLFQVLEMIRALPSGYNRDFQETKRPFMQGFEVAGLSLKVLNQIFAELEVDTDRCIGAFSVELFATDQVLRLVEQGVPFRDAYAKIARDPEGVTMEDPIENIMAKSHLGAPGNLGLEMSCARLNEARQWHAALKESWQQAQIGLVVS